LLKKIGLALKELTPHLSPFEKKDMYDALDWYNTEKQDELPAVVQNRQVMFVDLPDGRWPVQEMSLEDAKTKFKELQRIHWLELKPK